MGTSPRAWKHSPGTNRDPPTELPLAAPGSARRQPPEPAPPMKTPWKSWRQAGRQPGQPGRRAGRPSRCRGAGPYRHSRSGRALAGWAPGERAATGILLCAGQGVSFGYTQTSQRPHAWRLIDSAGPRPAATFLSRSSLIATGWILSLGSNRSVPLTQSGWSCGDV